MRKIDWFDVVSGICIAILTTILVVIFVGFIALAVCEPTSNFDTTSLETWCGEPSGTIRMVGGWHRGGSMIEDETGEIWSVDIPVFDEEFYLLWIDDMGTPSVKDDEIIKIWSEAH